jgi:hypothetical protein
LFLIAPLQGETHTFTNSSGKAIKGELVSHKKGKITLRREDGKEFELAPTAFSTADQEFIAEWINATPEHIDYKFRIIGGKHKLSGTTSNSAYSRLKNEQWSYKISITNQAQNAVTDLTIHYRLIHRDSSYSKKGVDQMSEGIEQMDVDLAFNRTLVITTKPLTLSSASYTYSGTRYKDELLGCLVRIKDQQNNVIIDWVSSGLSMKDKTWSSTSPRGKDGGESLIIK